MRASQPSSRDRVVSLFRSRRSAGCVPVHRCNRNNETGRISRRGGFRGDVITGFDRAGSEVGSSACGRLRIGRASRASFCSNEECRVICVKRGAVVVGGADASATGAQGVDSRSTAIGHTIFNEASPCEGCTAERTRNLRSRDRIGSLVSSLCTAGPVEFCRYSRDDKTGRI